jgi:hypothetical protein
LIKTFYVNVVTRIFNKMGCYSDKLYVKSLGTQKDLTLRFLKDMAKTEHRKKLTRSSDLEKRSE